MLYLFFVNFFLSSLISLFCCFVFRFSPKLGTCIPGTHIFFEKLGLIVLTPLIFGIKLFLMFLDISCFLLVLIILVHVRDVSFHAY